MRQELWKRVFDSDSGANRKSKNKNRKGLALCAMLLALGFPAEAQQPARIPRIGFVSNRVSPTPATPDLVADAFWQGLRKLDYVEGKNVFVDRRYAEGKHTPWP